MVFQEYGRQSFFCFQLNSVCFFLHCCWPFYHSCVMYVCRCRNTLKDRPWWTWCVSTSTCWRRTTLVWPLPTQTPRRSVNCVPQWPRGTFQCINTLSTEQSVFLSLVGWAASLRGALSIIQRWMENASGQQTIEKRVQLEKRWKMTHLFFIYEM